MILANMKKKPPGETVAGYVPALCKIAEFCICDYHGDVLNDVLPDRFADKQVQLTRAYTDHEARDMALAAETADKDSKRLQVEKNDSEPTVPPMSQSSHQEGTIAHVDKPTYKSRVNRARPGKGPT
jgi:hypothetical protein